MLAGEGVRTVELSLDDLKTRFKSHTVTATLQCTGNRRHEINEVKPVQVLVTDRSRAYLPRGRHANPRPCCLTAIVPFIMLGQGAQLHANFGTNVLWLRGSSCACLLRRRALTGMSGPSATLRGQASGCQTC